MRTQIDRRNEDRRSRAARPRWPERRTGFDRRERHPVTRALRDNPWLLVALALTLNLLNVLDLALTRLGLSLGAIEANPVMNAIFQHGWVNAALFKIGVMLLVTAGVWWLRRYRRVLQVAFAATLLYSVLALYHFTGLLLLA